LEAVTQLLEQREQAFPKRRYAAALSLLVHLAILAAVFLGPALLADRPEPIKFVEVTVLPSAALQPGPRPVAAQRTRAPEPAPEKPPEKPPEPPKEEPPPDVPVLQPEKKPEPRREETPPRVPDTAPVARDQPAREAGVDRDLGRPASTGDSATAAIASFDDPDFRYGYYIDRVLALIRDNWNPPDLGRTVEMMVSFRITADGEIEQLRIVTSSRVGSFDRAGLRAVEASSPLPPLPRGYQKPSLGVNLIIRSEDS
jgi:colicin import membrane protein